MRIITALHSIYSAKTDACALSGGTGETTPTHEYEEVEEETTWSSDVGGGDGTGRGEFGEVLNGVDETGYELEKKSTNEMNEFEMARIVVHDMNNETVNWEATGAPSDEELVKSRMSSVCTRTVDYASIVERETTVPGVYMDLLQAHVLE